MTLTHWFLLFGGLTIIAITIDGVRRMVSRPSTLAIDIDETLQNLPTDEFRAELPNGGARAAGSGTSLNVGQVAVTTVAVAEPVVVPQEVVVAETEQVVVAQQDEVLVEELEVEDFEVSLTETDAEVESLSVELDEEVLLTTVAEVEEAEASEEVVLEQAPEIEVAAELEEVSAELETSEQAEAPATEEVIAEDLAPAFDLAAPEEVAPQALVDDENPLAAAFDPTRPVHEAVEIHKMVQSDMFADPSSMAEQEEPVEAMGDWQEYAGLEEDTIAQVVEEQSEVEAEVEMETQVEIEASELEEPQLDTEQQLVAEMADDEALEVVASGVELEELEVVESVATTSDDDILLTDTGLDDQDNQADTLGSRLAKVTSFSFGKKLLENRRKQAEEAEALEALTQAEGSVVANVQEVLTIIVAAKDPQGFYGSNLRSLVEACGMVHGSMDLFHRHEDGLTEGQTQFSMANMTQSGAFDVYTMANVHTAGVVFFMTLPSANDSIRAFDYMLETAQCLANNLGGELYDEHRSVLRAQTVEHYRQRIREFERQRLARRAHGGN